MIVAQGTIESCGEGQKNGFNCPSYHEDIQKLTAELGSCGGPRYRSLVH